MASVKGLKKDIKFLTEVVITDAVYVGEMLLGKEDQEKADEVIIGAVAMYNDLVDRANHPDAKDNRNMVKKYYKKVSEDLMTQTDELLTTLNKLLDKA